MMASRAPEPSRPTGPLNGLLSENGRTKGPHHPEMFGDDDLLAKPLFQGGPDAHVGGYSPWKRTGGSIFFPRATLVR